MSNAGLEALDHSVQIAHEWINELDERLGWNDRHRSYRLLRAVLQVLRDCLPVAEAAHFSAQLPIMLRGVFFEHWQPASERQRHWDIDHFFAGIDAFFRQDPIENVDEAVVKVFRVIGNRVSSGEVAHIAGCLPQEIRALWRPD